MYRIMIVDDEPLILAGVTSLLNWEDHQCRIVGKASNGQMALCQMESLHPDIVITDIKMPAMDGISLMKACMEKKDSPAFILLTNLEEFSLAKEALHLGAVDYLVKLELDENSLLQALEAAKERRRLNRSQGQSSEVLELTIEERIRSYFQNLLIYDVDEIPDRNLSVVVRERFKAPLLMLINFNYGFEWFSPAFTREDQKKIMGFAENIISEMVRGFFRHSCLIRREQNGFALVLSLTEPNDYQQTIRTMSTKFKQVIKDYFEVSVSMAASLPGKDLDEIQDLFYQAMNAMNYAYYETSGNVVFYSEKCEENLRHRSNFNINFLKKDLTTMIRQNDGAGFSDIMNQIIRLFSECRPSRPQAVNACNNLYYFIGSLFEGGQDFPYVVDIVGQLNRMNSSDMVISWLEGFRDQVARVLDSHRENRKDKNIELACQYIEEHYEEKITLSQMAERLNISQGHLSSTFKKQTGKRFSDYVTEVKIQKAKELIATYQYMMYEVSDMLGFDNPYYFSSVFKKITGYTPKEYENRMVRKS